MISSPALRAGALSVAVVLGGCMFTPQARLEARRSAAQTEALKSQITRALGGFQRALKGKLWASAEPLCYGDDPDAIRALKSRVETLWKRGQLLDIAIDVVKVRREKDLTVATVDWTRTLLEKGALNQTEGRCEVYFKKQDEQLKVLNVGRDSFLD